MSALSNYTEPSRLPTSERDLLVITYVKMPDGSSVPLSYFADNVWDYTPYFPHAARSKSDKEIQWQKTPSEWIESLKGAVFAFTYHKPPGGIQLDPATIPKRTVTLNAFAKWCSASGIRRFQDVRGFDVSRYLQKLRDEGVKDRTLASHIAVLRKIFEMRAFMVDSFTAEAMTALSFDQVGALWEPGVADERRTELIPIHDAGILFSAALEHLKKADEILRLRDELLADWGVARPHLSRKRWGAIVKNPWVRHAGFRDVFEFDSELLHIRTAAFIVLAQSTGCRVHELGDIRVGCVYSEVIDGETYWWLKSFTRKIGDGPERWLAPEIAERAVAILERFSEPLRRQVADELAAAEEQCLNAEFEGERARLAARVLELKRNSTRLFLNESPRGVVSTDTQAHNKQLQAFARRKGVHFDSPLTTHRFRRTYAVIVVHLNKGARIDLVALQHHFKHSSLVMSEWYAALPATDRELYELIEDETGYFDANLVDHWMDPTVPLAGGLGKRIKAYAGKHHLPMFFTTRRAFVESIREGLNIRSTGHSWCLADAQDCGGRGLFEAPRCGGCANGVIDDHFVEVWENLRAQQVELVELTDIGPGGQEKARRSLAAADAVLAGLTTDEEFDGRDQ